MPRQFVDFAADLAVERDRLEHVVQFIGQFRRQRREIIDEIERVLDLVRDASGELAERGQLLGLDQAILRGAQFFEGRGQIVGALAQFIEKAGILDGDDGLGGELLEKRDLLVREALRFLPENHDAADHALVLQQRHGQKAARAPEIDQGAAVRLARTVSIRLQQVDELDMRLTFQQTSRCCSRSVVQGSASPVFVISRGKSVRRAGAKYFPVERVQDAEIRTAKMHRLAQHRVEYRREVAGRAADDLKNLRGRGLLLQRLREVARARLHFFEQPHVPIAITAWSAKVCSNSICLSVKGSTRARRNR